MSPIRPENRKRYGADWAAFSRAIRFDRARQGCTKNRQTDEIDDRRGNERRQQLQQPRHRSSFRHRNDRKNRREAQHGKGLAAQALICGKHAVAQGSLPRLIRTA